ncbi:MAG: hypothetical protein JXA13_01150 [Anaerolineales bacterium]|nr:hypothetical protein [Anaerolineales bacterium]
MKIIAIEQEAAHVVSEHFQVYLEEEARCLWDLVQSGGRVELVFVRISIPLY